MRLPSDGDTEGIAGLPGPGTSITGVPLASGAERPLPDWPLVLVMAFVAIAGAFGLIARDWGVYDGPASRPGATATPPVAADAPTSFLQPAVFRGALDTIAREAGPDARIQLMRVDPNQVWVVLGKEGKQQIIRVTGNGVSVDRGGESSGPGVPLVRIDVEVPMRILAGLQTDFAVRPEQLEYLVLADFPGRGRWSAFLLPETGRAPAHFGAGLDGRRLERIG